MLPFHYSHLLPTISNMQNPPTMPDESNHRRSFTFRLSNSHKLPWRWAHEKGRPVSRPYFPYPDEEDAELKEREHFGWYDSQTSIRPSTSNLYRASRPLSFPFAPNDDVDISTDPRDAPPDGGKLAWLHAFAGFLVIFNAQGLNMAFGVFQAYLEKVLLPTTSSSKIAWIGSCQIFLVFFMALLVSPAVQKGHFRLCFSGGSAVLCLSILATSYCTTWWQFFLVQGLMTGMAMGTVFASGLVVLISYFTLHLNVATGIAAAGGPAGGIIFPLIARSAITKIGFGGTVRVFALINLITMGTANLIVRERRLPRTATGVVTKEPVTSTSSSMGAPYMLMTAGMFCTFSGFFVAYYYIVLYGQDVIGLSNESAIDLLVAMNAANLIGRVMPSLIADACKSSLLHTSAKLTTKRLRSSQHTCAMDDNLLHLRISMDLSCQQHWCVSRRMCLRFRLSCDTRPIHEHDRWLR